MDIFFKRGIQIPSFLCSINFAFKEILIKILDNNMIHTIVNKYVLSSH